MKISPQSWEGRLLLTAYFFEGFTIFVCSNQGCIICTLLQAYIYTYSTPEHIFCVYFKKYFSHLYFYNKQKANWMHTLQIMFHWTA